MNKQIDIILDPAHGEDIAGKRSPDGKHREYLWSRDRCKSLEYKLKKLGYVVNFTSTSNNEIGLGKRVENADAISLQESTRSLLISIHNDAYTDNWNNAHGYSVYTTKGKTKSDEFAQILLLEFSTEFPNLELREDKTDGDLDKEENFAVLKGKNYSAVLIEWLFQTNKKEVELINDPNYIERFENCIIKAIEKWK